MGAIAGGTIGGVAALALALTVIWWFFIRKRRKARKDNMTLDSGSAPSPAAVKADVSGEPHEIDGLGGATAGKPAELEGVEKDVERQELGEGRRTAAKPVQLADQHGISELPG